MNPKTPLEEYRAAEQELLRIRKAHNDWDSQEEDDHLDRMDILWERLSEDGKRNL